MTAGLRHAARSSNGMAHESNLDSVYAGRHLLVVTSGTRSHQVVRRLRELDRDILAEDLVPTLGQAIASLGGPSGGALTSLLWSGRYAALGHVGGSSAYLLRGGALARLTGNDAEVRLLTADLHDRYLLCTDGLSSVVDDSAIQRIMVTAPDPDQAVWQLILQANRAGGPDNITCVVADVGGPPTAAAHTMAEPVPAEPPHPAAIALTGYEIFEPLGDGGNAVVYRARRTALDREVAIKVVLHRLIGHKERQRFGREVGAAVRLSEHPNVVTLYDAGTLPDERPYLVMELCPGGSLAGRLRERGRLPAEEVRRIGVQVADALADAHLLGVLHRDIKPANLLITRFGRVAVADFGIASLIEPGQAASATLSMTPVYAAPEVFDGARPEPTCDVYSLGATLYALLCGRPPRLPHLPLEGPALIAHMHRMRDQTIPDIAGVPDPLMAVVRTCLNPDPAFRHPSAAALRDALIQVAPARPEA